MASDPKVHAFEEAVKHNKTKDCWLAISGKVYDVTPFMEDHPGGDEVLLSATGKDATNDFEDVGHSDAAREQMEQKKKSADRSLLVDVMFLGFSKFAAVVNIAPAAVSKKKKKSMSLVVGP